MESRESLRFHVIFLLFKNYENFLRILIPRNLEKVEGKNVKIFRAHGLSQKALRIPDHRLITQRQ